MNNDEMDIKQSKTQEAPQFNPYSLITNMQPCLQENSTEIIMTNDRTVYVATHMEEISNQLAQYAIRLQFTPAEKSIKVIQTVQCPDPTAYHISRNFINLISRGFDVQIARLIFDEKIECDIMNIDLCNKDDTFVKRRQRLFGEDKKTLMALEMLTNTHLSLYGKTMAIIGSEHGIQLVRRIMVDIFVNNQLPALWIKKLMVMRELQKMPELKDQPWEQFLPKVRKGKGRSKARVSKQKKSGLELVDVGKYSERKTDKLIDLGVSTKRSAKNKGKHNFKKQQHK